MDAPYYSGEPFDDDPFGEHRPESDDCPSCGARDGEPCEAGCACDVCVAWRERIEIA